MRSFECSNNWDHTWAKNWSDCVMREMTSLAVIRNRPVNHRPASFLRSDLPVASFFSDVQDVGWVFAGVPITMRGMAAPQDCDSNSCDVPCKPRWTSQNYATCRHYRYYVQKLPAWPQWKFDYLLTCSHANWEHAFDAQKAFMALLRRYGESTSAPVPKPFSRRNVTAYQACVTGMRRKGLLGSAAFYNQVQMRWAVKDIAAVYYANFSIGRNWSNDRYCTRTYFTGMLEAAHDAWSRAIEAQRVVIEEHRRRRVSEYLPPPVVQYKVSLECLILPPFSNGRLRRWDNQAFFFTDPLGGRGRSRKRIQ